jgi:hypothetical protein
MYYTMFRCGQRKPKRQRLTQCVTLTLCIYAYQRQGRVTYVGQTKQSLSTRDQQHLCGSTVFDRDYQTHRAEYGAAPTVLEQKVFTEHVSGLEEEAQFLLSSQTWLDSRETYWIQHYQTYLTGKNQTTGGQQGLEMSYFLSHLKRRDDAWTRLYMPLLRSSEFGQKCRLWETPQNYIWQHLPMGKLLNNLRCGDRRIPGIYIQEMEELGYNGGKGYRASRFEMDYLPAFRSSSYGQLKRLWETPQSHTHRGIRLGKILNHLRTGGHQVPAEMNLLGYNDGKSIYQSRFELDLMVQFRSCVFGQRKRLWETPQNFITADGFKLGRILNHLRRDVMSVPDSCREEMEHLGFKEGRGFYESRFEVDYLPAIEDCSYGRRKRLDQTPRNHVHMGVHVGQVLHSSKIPGFKCRLEEMGWKNPTGEK